MNHPETAPKPLGLPASVALYATGAMPIVGAQLRLTRLVVCSTAGLPPEQWTCPRELRLQ